MSTQIFLMLVFVFLPPFLYLLLLGQRKKPNHEAAKSRLPPGPRKLPLIGNLHQLGGMLYRSLQRLSAEYGPLMFLQLGLIPTLIVSSADMAREIFKTHDRVFSGRPVFYAAKRLSYNLSSVSFAPYGDYWREVRKIVILELLSAKRVQSFQSLRDEEVAHMLDSVSLSSGPVNLSELTLSLANNIVCRAAFGKKYDGGGSDSKSGVYQTLRETQELVGGFYIAEFFPWMGWLNKFNGQEARVEKNFRQLDEFYEKVIEEHRSPKPGNDEDLVDVLLRLQKDSNQEIPLHIDQIKAVLTDMFIAGTDTSSATIVWIMSELIRNPSVMQRVQVEVRETVKGKQQVEESDLQKLIYLKSIVKEGFRLHPPVPLLLPRETTESCTIGGFHIPANTRVFFNAKSIGEDPKYWKNPKEFRPERFLLDSSVDFKGQHFELLPFGAGRRGCPGIQFATQLIELALANLLHRFDWEMADAVRREELDMEEAVGLTMHKKVPLLLMAKPPTF
ncbi:cytochrome P450 71A9-like [Juglans microcarpa x Juglans regia]|uniref:cytochrome P450 71A9-like n=1 Tax=Juglans microcarpa x Juglans regia TaxID=2249226 RepID=UPI001B7F11F3|nr:cytochrome P450 71A9-like [Juglans microcarpa x Juglans regia]